MGNTQGFQNAYSVPLKNSQTSPDVTPILRAATHPDGLVEKLCDEECETSWHLFQRGKALNYGRQKCLGYRKRSAIDGTLAEDFSWLNYNDVEKAALAIGTCLLEADNCMDFLEYDDEVYVPARKMRLLGIFSKNCVEWFVCEQAANAYDFALVPLYDTLGKDALEYILNQTRLKTVACSLECLPLLLEGVQATKHLKTILMFLNPHEQISPELRQLCDEAHVTLLIYTELIESFDRRPLPVCPGSFDDINTVCFTSGTTGKPKGVFLTHRNLVSCAAAIIRGPIAGDFSLCSSDTTISYLPLAHVLERLVCNVVFAQGASIGVYSGDTTKLLDDVRCLKPTIFVSVPRLFNRINDAVFRGVTDKSIVAKYLFNRGMSNKLDHLRHNAATTNRLWDSLVFNKTRQLMGNRLRYMISGGAPLDAIVQEHMKVLFCAPLMEGYGLTETFGPAFLANPNDPVAGHVGGPIPCNEFRLLSVPEMSYRITDHPPRGELLIRGHSITIGYFRDSEETAATIDKDGWLHTGDIAVLLPGGSVKIIDRKKNIFKLAQGEYVAPEKIEGVYVQAPLVSQVFVFGYSDKNFLVAIVVPDPDALKSWLKRHPDIDRAISMASLCNATLLKESILTEMDVVAGEAGLKGFEKVKDIYVESSPFTVEDGILTPTLKIKRHEAKKMFQDKIDAMYSNVDKNI